MVLLDGGSARVDTLYPAERGKVLVPARQGQAPARLAVRGVRMAVADLTDTLRNPVLGVSILRHLDRQDYNSVRVALPALREELPSIESLAKKNAALQLYQQRLVMQALTKENPAYLATLGNISVVRCDILGKPDPDGDALECGCRFRADQTLNDWKRHYLLEWRPVTEVARALVHSLGYRLFMASGQPLSSRYSTYPLSAGTVRFGGLRTIDSWHVHFPLDKMDESRIALTLQILQDVGERTMGRSQPFTRCLTQVMIYRLLAYLQAASLPALRASFTAELKAKHAHAFDYGEMLARHAHAGPIRPPDALFRQDEQ